LDKECGKKFTQLADFEGVALLHKTAHQESAHQLLSLNTALQDRGFVEALWGTGM